MFSRNKPTVCTRPTKTDYNNIIHITYVYTCCIYNHPPLVFTRQYEKNAVLCFLQTAHCLHKTLTASIVPQHVCTIHTTYYVDGLTLSCYESSTLLGVQTKFYSSYNTVQHCVHMVLLPAMVSVDPQLKANLQRINTPYAGEPRGRRGRVTTREGNRTYTHIPGGPQNDDPQGSTLHIFFPTSTGVHPLDKTNEMHKWKGSLLCNPHCSHCNHKLPTIAKGIHYNTLSFVFASLTPKLPLKKARRSLGYFCT